MIEPSTHTWPCSTSSFSWSYVSLQRYVTVHQPAFLFEITGVPQGGHVYREYTWQVCQNLIISLQSAVLCRNFFHYAPYTQVLLRKINAMMEMLNEFKISWSVAEIGKLPLNTTHAEVIDRSSVTAQQLAEKYRQMISTPPTQPSSDRSVKASSSASVSELVQQPDTDLQVTQVAQELSPLKMTASDVQYHPKGKWIILSESRELWNEYGMGMSCGMGSKTVDMQNNIYKYL